MDIKIRPFEDRDLERVLIIERAAFPDPFTQGEFLMWATTEPDSFLVAELKRKVVGYVLVSMDNGGQLISIAVHPKYARRGIGRKLLQAGIELLKSKGAKHILAEARVSNKVGRAFLEKNSFKKVKILKHYYDDGEDAIQYKRKL